VSQFLNATAGGTGPESNYVHPLVSQLKSLAVDYIEFAGLNKNMEAAAVGHILSAVLEAIDNNDLAALNAKHGPHAWARASLRQRGVSRPGRYLPIENKNNQLLDSMDRLNAVFGILANIVERAILGSRATGNPLDAYACYVTTVLARGFPSLSILPLDDVQKLLRSKAERFPSHDARNLGKDIASELLEGQLRHLKRSPREIRRALKFLDR
jgi:hypothetical protein